MPQFDFLKTQGKDQVPQKSTDLKHKARTVGVNLMASEVVREATNKLIRKNLLQLFVSFLIALVIALIAYGALLFYGAQVQKKVATIRLSLDAADQEIRVLEKDNSALIGFQNKLSAIKSLLDERTSIAPFFPTLEKNTLKEVSYKTLSIEEKGAVALTAATTSYTNLGRQLLAFDESKDFITSVDISGISASLDQLGSIIGVNFNISLVLDPKLLKQSVQQ